MVETLPFSANIMNILRFSQNIANTTHKRLIKNYELDFSINCDRKITINGEEFSLRSSSVVFRKPGDYVTSVGKYNCYCLTLDFSGLKQEYCGNYDRNSSDDPVQQISSNPLLELIPPHFIALHAADYIKIFDKIYCAHQLLNEKETCSILINQLFFLILSDVYYLKENSHTAENKIFTATCQYIQSNYHKAVTVEELAKNVSLSPSYFIKLFKKIANTTPTEYLISVRISNAKQFLAESDLSIAAIAELCGFNDASYFSYYFKKRCQVTPNQYRETIKQS